MVAGGASSVLRVPSLAIGRYPCAFKVQVHFSRFFIQSSPSVGLLPSLAYSDPSIMSGLRHAFDYHRQCLCQAAVFPSTYTDTPLSGWCHPVADVLPTIFLRSGIFVTILFGLQPPSGVRRIATTAISLLSDYPAIFAVVLSETAIKMTKLKKPSKVFHCTANCRASG